MKIAKEIAEHIEDRQCPGGEMSAAMLENIVAAKLEPVKKALNDLIETCTSSDVMEFGETPDREAIRGAQAALALFEDECDHEWVDATNEVVSGGEVCVKCHAIRATHEEDL